MANVLVGFASTFGQTKKVALQIAEWLEAMGHRPSVYDLVNGSPPDDVSPFDAAVLAGSIHRVRHQPELERFAQGHGELLRKRPTLLISVSLSAAGKQPRQLADAQRCIEEFAVRVGWSPSLAVPVAGALNYTRYNFLLRHMMRKIAAEEGGDTDTSRDFEYTDWAALESFIDQFALTYLEPLAKVSSSDSRSSG